MKWPAYLPYPISLIRAFFQISAIFISGLMLLGNDDLIEGLLPRVLFSPFGLVSFLMIPIAIMMLSHWIFRNVLHQLKGVAKPKVLDSLWEGIYGWMTAVFSCALTMFFFIIPTILAIEFEDRYYDGWYWRSYIDDSNFLLSCFIIYSVITIYLYQLEHLIRFPLPSPQTSQRQQEKTPTKPSAKTKFQSKTTLQNRSPKTQPSPPPTSSTTPRKTPQSRTIRPSSASSPRVPKTVLNKNTAQNVTPDDIDLELQFLKETYGKKSQ